MILFLNEARIDFARQRYADNDPRRDYPDMLRRLLTYEGMQKVWVALTLSKKPRPEMMFAFVAGYGFCGPLDEAGFTPAKHRAYLEKVQELSSELAKLLRGSALDMRLVEHLDLLHPDVEGIWRRAPIWYRFSQVLDSVASSAPYLAKESARKRSGEDARRAYFVRELTRFFREYLGGPRRALVAIATAAAFDDPSMSFGVRQITRLAP